MFEGVLRPVVKIVAASLIVGTMLAHFGITTDVLMKEFGISPEKVEELVRKRIAANLPNIMLGSFIILPVWIVVSLFRPPRPSSA